MPFCTKCGTDAQGKFCPSCGASMDGSATAAPGPAVSSGDLDENVASALAYLLGPLTGVLFLVLEPYNRNRTVRFHAFQSIFVFLGLFAVNLVISFLAWIPFLGWLIAVLGWTVLPIASLALWIILMVKAYNKERWVLPIVGAYAEKQV